MSLIEKGNWPASRKKAAERRALELPRVEPTGWYPEVDADGRVWTVYTLPMAHEVDMLKGNADD
jgi:hypothetical protein